MPMAIPAAPGGSGDSVRLYLERVKELVPSEITAAFLAINTAIPLDERWLDYLYGFFVVLVIACWFYLSRFKGVSNLYQLLFVTLVAFPVWAFNIAVARFDFIANATFIPSCVLIVVTLFAPLIAPSK
jgi:hypothetical protein